MVRDHNWVSSRQPSDIPDFNREIIALFSDYLTMLQGKEPFVPESEYGANNTQAEPTGAMYGSMGGQSKAEKDDTESKWINGEAEKASPA